MRRVCSLSEWSLERTSMDKLKNRLRVLRAERDISQEVLAKAVGVSRQTILAIEGVDCSPSIVVALKGARYFGKKMEEVFWLEAALKSLLGI